MQQLRTATGEPASPEGCARELLAGIPLAMRFIRGQMRGNRQAGLSVPQLRTLVFVNFHDRSSLSSLAEHLGLSLPAVSRLVDGLVRRGLLDRQPAPGDRRCVCLSLTSAGLAAFSSARAATEKSLARRFDCLSTTELTVLTQAMNILNRVFVAHADGRSDGAACQPTNSRTASARGGRT